MDWILKTISTDSEFFTKVFQKVIKTVEHPKEEVTISVKNKDKKQLYKFVFQWSDENQCGIDVYREVPDEIN